MEYLDVLDENGIFTGEIVTREEAHRLGKWHRAIIVAIVNNENKFFSRNGQSIRRRDLRCGILV